MKSAYATLAYAHTAYADITHVIHMRVHFPSPATLVAASLIQYTHTSTHIKKCTRTYTLNERAYEWCTFSMLLASSERRKIPYSLTHCHAACFQRVAKARFALLRYKSDKG